MNVQTIIGNKGTEVATIVPDATLADCVNVLGQHKVGALVVSVNGKSIDGIISERDIVRAIANGGPESLNGPVAEAMTAEVVTCSAADGVDLLMELMTNRRIRHLPVAGGDGDLAGIVSIGDVVKARLASLELENQALSRYISGH